MNNMCTVIAYFYAKPEKVEEVEKILQNFVAQTRQEPFLKSFLDKRTAYLTKDIEVKTYTMLSEYNKGS